MSSVSSASLETRRRQLSLEVEKEKMKMLSKRDNLKLEVEGLQDQENDMAEELKGANEDGARNLRSQMRDLRALRRGKKAEIAQVDRDIHLIETNHEVEISKLDEEQEVVDSTGSTTSGRSTPTSLERIRLLEESYGRNFEEGLDHKEDKQEKILEAMLGLLQLQKTNQTDRFLVRQTAGKELPAFSGNSMEWPAFIAQYKQTTTACGFSDVENLYRLEKALKGKAKEVVQAFLSTPDNVGFIIETLQERFGRPQHIIHALMKKTKEVPSPRDGKPETLVQFSDCVNNLVITISNLQRTEYLFNPSLLEELVSRMDGTYRIQWGQFVVCNQLSSPTLKDFSNWLGVLAKAAQYVSPPDLEQKKEDSSKKNILASSEEKTTEDKRNCRYCKGKGHFIRECRKFKAQPVENRIQWVNDNNLCRSCFGPRHTVKTCRFKEECKKDGCKSFHNRLLHEDRKMESEDGKKIVIGPPKDGQINPGGSKTLGYHNDESDVLLRMLPVIIRGPKRAIQTFAMFDEGATCTLIDQDLADELDLEGNECGLTLTWTNGITEHHDNSRRVTCTLESVEDNSGYKLQDVRTVSHLDLPSQTVDMLKLKERYHHLKHVPARSLFCVQPKILIGEDNAYLTIPREVKDSSDHQEPIASRSLLGWTVHGKNTWKNGSKGKFSFHATMKNWDEELSNMVKESFKLEAIGIKVPDQELRSKDDDRAAEIMDQTTKKVSKNRWETGLLWKMDKIQFPESYKSAQHRLHLVEKKLDKNPDYADWYYEKMNYYIKAGYATPVSERKGKSADAMTWYIPHFAASNPHKPGKLRLVFDAAAKCGGTSLNDNLLTGPDLLNSLAGVLMRFRRKTVGFAGDVKEMFHQVNIQEEDRGAQRFLWRGAARNVKPTVMQMNVMMFGSACSPCSSQFVMRRNADNWRMKYPKSVLAIHRDIYMDDCLHSEDTEEEAIQRVAEINEIQSSGGFEMMKWISSSPRVLDSISEDRKAEVGAVTVTDESSLERVLGLHWNPVEDCFQFNLNFPKVDINVVRGTRMPSKKEVLKLIMSLFDPLGMLASFTIKMRILFQDVWRSEVDWNDKLPVHLYEKWKDWLEELMIVTEVKVPRCYSTRMPFNSKIHLHLFADASEQAYASVAYLQIVTEDNHREVAFVFGKARVAPLKPVSIPRMELQGALMSVRIAGFIKKEIDLPIQTTTFWTDSQTVLCWIKSDARKYKQFVANRIGEILESSDVMEWKWVPTNENPADEGTREKAGFSPKNKWLSGPEFLKMSSEMWPVQPSQLSKQHAELEAKRICQVITSNTNQTIISIVHRYSSYWRLLKSVTLARRFVQKLKSKVQGKQWEGNELSNEDIWKTEEFLWKTAQRTDFLHEVQGLQQGKEISMKSKIVMLTPFLDEIGVMRLGSRTKRADVPFEVKYPVILDGKSPLSKLIVHHYHLKFKHYNMESVVNEVKQKFWIVGLRRLLKRVILDCNMCKLKKSLPKPTIMGLLPEERLDYKSRPFTHCGLDFFGPFTVAVGRRREKRYGVIFTCLTVRAVHLDVAHSLTTDSAIMVISRFISERGTPTTLISDNATNFKGSANELEKQMRTLNGETLGSFARAKNITWKFNCPLASHMGGAYERLIKSVKIALYAALEERGIKEHSPTDEVLRTCLLEAGALVNSRPITVVSDDPEATEALTPNHFLIQSSGIENPFRYLKDVEQDLRKKWIQAQRISDYFWKRWLREYLPTLAPRKKWNRKEKPIGVGDIVFLAESTLPRGQWMKGIIQAVHPGKDGVVRVVDVRTAKGILRRPITKCAVLDFDPQNRNGGECH